MKPTIIAQHLHRKAKELYADARLAEPCDEPSLIETMIEYSQEFEKLANELEVFAKWWEKHICDPF